MIIIHDYVEGDSTLYRTLNSDSCETHFQKIDNIKIDTKKDRIILFNNSKSLQLKNSTTQKFDNSKSRHSKIRIFFSTTQIIDNLASQQLKY